MNRRNTRRCLWLKWGVTILSLAATLVGWKGFLDTNPQATAATDGGGAAASLPAPAPDDTAPVRMAIVTEPDGQTYLVQLPAVP
ncbi:MAG TPA: hypothetical protein VKW09_02225 [bacterium]|nr:hypothetical protein [bacterium]